MSSLTLRDSFEYGTYRAGAALLRLLPLRAVCVLARLMGRLGFFLNGRQVGATLENLSVAYPELSPADRFQLGRESFFHFVWNMLDAVRSQSWSDQELRARVSIEGLEHMEAARAPGKGVLLLSGHIGNFELAVQALSLEGLPLLVIARPIRNTLLWKRIAKSRSRFGAELVDRERAAGQMLRALRNNRIVAVLNDQYASPSHGVFAPLFGVRASTAAGVATLAVRTGAAIVPGYMERVGADQHVFHFLPALELELSGDRKRDIEVSAAAQNAVLERMIRIRPEQWMWGHRRFRHSPDLAGDPYRRVQRRARR